MVMFFNHKHKSYVNITKDRGGDAMGSSVDTANGKLCDFESQTLVVQTGSDSSTSKRSAIDVSVTGPRR